MGNWKKITSERYVYKEIVKDGFLATQGTIALNPKDHPFGNSTPSFPLFQLLKVHRNYPMRVIDTGDKLNVRPKGDERLIGRILRDKDKTIYDSVSFFLAPYDIQLDETYPGKVVARMHEGFTNLDGEKVDSSLVYLDGKKEKIEIDSMGVRHLSRIMPSQIARHLSDWLYSVRGMSVYDGNNNNYQEVGEFDLRHVPIDKPCDVTKQLEERFNTRLFGRERYLGERYLG